jgi:CBS domain-containing protein
MTMMFVRDVMSRSVISVRPGTQLKEVAQLLVDNKISGVPVVSESGEVLGVVSEADFLIKEQGAEAVHTRRLDRILGESRESREQRAKLAAITAGAAMTSPAVTIESWRSISEAAAVMTERKINRLPVVDDDAIVGIVTRADLVRAYVRTDEQLAREIKEEVIARSLWLEPALFEVSVDNGVATVRGQVDLRSEAEAMEHMIRRTPGILEVFCDVTWSREDARLEPSTL